MHWKSISSILIALSIAQNGFGDPLTQQENAIRLATCGKRMRAKVYKGTQVENFKAPWSVFVNLITSVKTEGTTTMTNSNICTGTIVSPRHILTATHCFATLDKNNSGAANKGWYELKVGQMDAKSCDEDRHYIIKDETVLKGLSITLGDKMGTEEKTIAAYPEKVTLLHGCVKHEVAGDFAGNDYEDVAIIDLYEDLDLGSLQQACVASSIDDNRPGTELDYYGYGNDFPGTDVSEDKKLMEGKPPTTGILRHEHIVVGEPGGGIADHFFNAVDPNHKVIACQGDSGGGSIGKINGRNTIIGVLSQTTCSIENKRIGPTSNEMYESVGFFHDTICKLTGICDTTTRYRDYFLDYRRQDRPPRSSTPSALSDTMQRQHQNRHEDDPDAAADKFGALFVALVSIAFMMVL